MLTVCTTHNIEVFKLFYNHKLHDVFREDLYVYVDKDDSSEFEKIVIDCPYINNTHIYNQLDLKEYYGKMYNDHLKTFKKVYFINMLLEIGHLDNGFYFTDDDVLLFDRIDEIKKYNHIVYDHEVSNMSNVFVGGWKVIGSDKIWETFPIKQISDHIRE